MNRVSWFGCCAALAFAAGCSASPVVAPAPRQEPAPPIAVLPAISSAVALPSAEPQPPPQPPPKPRVPAMLKTGRFVPAAQLSVGKARVFPPEVMAATSVPGADDELWFVGGGGLRLHYQGGSWSGTQMRGECGPVQFEAVGSGGPKDTWVYSQEIVVLAPVPGCDFRRSLEVFGGKIWNAAGARVGQGAAGFDGAKLWLIPLVQPPGGRPLWSRSRGRWSRPNKPPGSFTTVNTVAPFKGGVWVLGETQKGHGLAVFDGREWTEHEFSQNGWAPAITAASDGTAWFVDKGLWRATKEGIDKIEPPGLDGLHLLGIAHATSANEVWINAYRDKKAWLKGRLDRDFVLLRLKDNQVTQVDILNEFVPVPPNERGRGGEDVREIVRSGKHVFMFREYRIWEWVPKGATPPKQVRLQTNDKLQLEVLRESPLVAH